MRPAETRCGLPDAASGNVCPLDADAACGNHGLASADRFQVVQLAPSTRFFASLAFIDRLVRLAGIGPAEHQPDAGSASSTYKSLLPWAVDLVDTRRVVLGIHRRDRRGRCPSIPCVSVGIPGQVKDGLEEAELANTIRAAASSPPSIPSSVMTGIHHLCGQLARLLQSLPQ
jgi:hypothetical protein